MRARREPLRRSPIRLCALPVGGYPRGYQTVLSCHGTLREAMRWGNISGLAAWTGPSAEAAGYGTEGRLSRLWIERAGHPATLTKE